MKKCLIVTFLCLFACLYFDNFYTAQGQTNAELEQTWRDAEVKIKEANTKMGEWEGYFAGYIAEYNTLTGMALTTGLTMWSTLDISKGLIVIQGPLSRLLFLEAAIFATIIYFDDLNKILENAVSERDTALANYNAATGLEKEAKYDPKYRNIPECRLPCNNFCGVIFSSNDVGLRGLGDAALSNHKTVCGAEGLPGCGDEYWTCDGKEKSQTDKHQVIYCRKLIKTRAAWSARLSIEGVCGAPYRKCSVTKGVHFYKKSHYSDRLWTAVESKHGNGTKDPPTVNVVYGPNGAGLDFTYPLDSDEQASAPYPAPTPTPTPPPSPSPGLSATDASTITINGEEMVDTAPGDTVYVSLVMPSDKGYSVIHWYLAGPDDSGLGSEIESPTYSSGNDIETETTQMFSMPSNASGVYTFTAYIYPHSSASDQTVYEYTLKIYCS